MFDIPIFIDIAISLSDDYRIERISVYRDIFDIGDIEKRMAISKKVLVSQPHYRLSVGLYRANIREILKGDKLSLVKTTKNPKPQGERLASQPIDSCIAVSTKAMRRQQPHCKCKLTSAVGSALAYGANSACHAQPHVFGTFFHVAYLSYGMVMVIRCLRYYPGCEKKKNPQIQFPPDVFQCSQIYCKSTYFTHDLISENKNQN